MYFLKDTDHYKFYSLAVRRALLMLGVFRLGFVVFGVRRFAFAACRFSISAVVVFVCCVAFGDQQ